MQWYTRSVTSARRLVSLETCRIGRAEYTVETGHRGPEKHHKEHGRNSRILANLGIDIAIGPRFCLDGVIIVPRQHNRRDHVVNPIRKTNVSGWRQKQKKKTGGNPTNHPIASSAGKTAPTEGVSQASSSQRRIRRRWHGPERPRCTVDRPLLLQISVLSTESMNTNTGQSKLMRVFR